VPHHNGDFAPLAAAREIDLFVNVTIHFRTFRWYPGISSCIYHGTNYSTAVPTQSMRVTVSEHITMRPPHNTSVF